MEDLMLGYLFWTLAALSGAVWAVKLFCAIPAKTTNLKVHILYTTAHAILLCGAIFMALSLFSIALSWPGKITILALVLLSDGLSLWQVSRSDK